MAAQDYASAGSMLSSAKILLGEDKQDVAVLLDSVISLLQADTVDANSVSTLLTTAKTLLS